MKSVCDIRELIVWGCGGGGENASGDVSVSYFRILSRELGSSQGGGRMLARRWRFRRRASQSGKGARCGGRREGVAPCGEKNCQFVAAQLTGVQDVDLLVGKKLTDRRFRLSSRWRGTTVTISISQRKATSIGVKPA